MILNIEHGRLVDLAEAFEACPTDAQIVGELVEALEMTPPQILDRLMNVDFVTVRREVAP
jgi:hypothetical protein